MLSQKTGAHELQYLRQLFTCPPGMFEQAHATISALENLVDTARENADADTLARLGCGSCLSYVPSSPAIYRLFTLRFSSPRFLFFCSPGLLEASSYPSSGLLCSGEGNTHIRAGPPLF